VNLHLKKINRKAEQAVVEGINLIYINVNKNIRLEVQFWKKTCRATMDQYLIPVEKIWQPSDFLPNSESDNFFRRSERTTRNI
jgi:hypothetical protein